MSSAAPEFSRPLTLDKIDRQREPLTIAAEPEERAALAARFAIDSIDTLSATVSFESEGDDVIARGRLAAKVMQTCVATGDPLPVTLDEPFAVRFIPEPGAAAPEEDEVELSADECDTMHYHGRAIDLGEAVAQTLLLSLDPYPRGPGAEDFLKAKGVKSESEAKREASPFGALAALKDTPDKD
jgi:uncharacterized metal-binding protein YceD (DUF177 family)